MGHCSSSPRASECVKGILLDVEYVQHRERLKSSASCGIVLSRSMNHTDHTDDTFNSLPAILVSRNNPSCVCRCQYNDIYFCELFLVAHFSRKFEKPSDKVPTVHFQLCDNDIVHFTTYLLSKMVLYSIYVIIYTYMGIN